MDIVEAPLLKPRPTFFMRWSRGGATPKTKLEEMDVPSWLLT
jgi:hypothetical protein